MMEPIQSHKQEQQTDQCIKRTSLIFCVHENYNLNLNREW
jgi:hypothetical protein